MINVNSNLSPKHSDQTHSQTDVRHQHHCLCPDNFGLLESDLQDIKWFSQRSKPPTLFYCHHCKTTQDGVKYKASSRTNYMDISIAQDIAKFSRNFQVFFGVWYILLESTQIYCQQERYPPIDYQHVGGLIQSIMLRTSLYSSV